MLPVTHPSPAAIAALRAQIGRHLPLGVPAARHGVLAFGDAGVDGCLGGGLALGQLHEVAADGIEAETGAVAAGFVAALAGRIGVGRGGARVFWIAPTPDLHAPGLLPYGLDPGRVVAVRTDDDAASLAAMETVLRAGAAAVVVGELARLGRTPSRRLQMACLRHGTTGFALRRWPHGRGDTRHREREEATASVTRWRVAAAPSEAAPSGFNSREPGRPRWRVALTHARGGREGEWIMEAGGPDDATHPFRVVAELAHAAAAAPQGAGAWARIA